MEFRAVRDPLWKHIYIPEPLADALSTPDFVRLNRIHQLGPTDLVYPGAVHTRAGHSIGVYGIARRLLATLEERGATAWISEQGRYSWYAAALFHDIGHFPYTHSLKELPLEEHERLSARIICGDTVAGCIAKAGGDPEQVAAIIDTSLPAADRETLFFRRLLSGVMDPDKLDYLNRDAYYCGVPYGIQDTDFVLDKLYPDLKQGITINSDAILSVENLLFSKYLMYRSVYWHRQVRVATAMMKKAVYGALSRKLIVPEQLYRQDDAGLFQLLFATGQESGRMTFPEKCCARNVAERNLYQVVFECPFDNTRQDHRLLEDITKRFQTEHILADILHIPPEFLVIDIPERISFESSLWISDENKPFSSSSTVFSENTVASFTGSLRKIRCAVSPVVSSYCEIKKIAEFFNMRYTVPNGGDHENSEYHGTICC